MTDDDRRVLDEILLELRALRLTTEALETRTAGIQAAYATLTDEVARMRAHGTARCDMRGAVLLRQLGQACLAAAQRDNDPGGVAA